MNEKEKSILDELINSGLLHDVMKCECVHSNCRCMTSVAGFVYKYNREETEQVLRSFQADLASKISTDQGRAFVEYEHQNYEQSAYFEGRRNGLQISYDLIESYLKG